MQFGYLVFSSSDISLVLLAVKKKLLSRDQQLFPELFWVIFTVNNDAEIIL